MLRLSIPRRAVVSLPASIFCAALVFCAPLASAEQPSGSTRFTEGLRESVPQTFALEGARVIVRPGVEIADATVLVEGDRIRAVGTEVEIPAGTQRIAAQGKTIYAGLIDAYSEADVEPPPADGAGYWNGKITPQCDAGGEASAGPLDKLRGCGITVRLVAPRSGILKGTSCLRLLGDRPAGAELLKSCVAQHIRLTVARGGDRDEYPNSPMGAVALARQAFYDAQWYGRAWDVYRSGSEVPRPETNHALERLGEAMRDACFIFDAPNEKFIFRAEQLAREFSLQLMIRGSGREYRRLEEVAALRRPILVPVDFPKAPNVATVEAAREVTLEALMHWDHAPENPGRLAAAGVQICLTTDGLKDPAKFLQQVRKAVARGLDADVALAALTTTPAALFDLERSVGTIEAGKLANLVVTDGDLFAAGTEVVETWVAGKRFRVAPESLPALAGRWRMQIDAPPARLAPLELVIRQRKDRWVASLELPSARSEPGGDQDEPTSNAAKQKTKEGQVEIQHLERRNHRIQGVFDASKLGSENLMGIAQLALILLEQEGEEEQLTGRIVWADGAVSRVTTRRVEQEEAASQEPAGEGASDGDAAESPDAAEDDPATAGEEREKSEAEKADAELARTEPASVPVNFPLGAFGRAAAPEQPAAVVFRDATVWTCGPEGVLQEADVLVESGKISAVGVDLEVPAGCVVIDARGRHVTPGIIDCHSHMATDGGVNESGSAVTSMVRIGDLIDDTDINIYRQLAGGVTTSNILHGSANPIGGQNQVIKLRWGASGEELKMREAPAGIKFALGENVKQSNWGERYRSRYPQTRMGVEQLFQDQFHAARRYDQRRRDWQREHRGLPPRRDLRLEAIAEILAGERWIHCHSYRQDEILALLDVLDEFEITIGSLQHILEGYKVADRMAEHGATGSSFSDWWAYKFEVYDAIPYNGALMHEAGVVVSFNSDDRELARHLNTEAAKATKYGGVPEEEALKFVTRNPAIQLRIDHVVGSLEPGKHADLVLWSGRPLSTLSRCEQTWIDGRKYFDRQEDLRRREEDRKRAATLVQKILAGNVEMQKPGEREPEEDELWPREDLFCGHHHGGEHHH